MVKLWNPSEPQQAISIYEGTAVYSLDFSHNNRVLAVAGEKGQAVLYGGKGAAVGTGCEPVGTIPRVPSETADSVTCLKFAPNDSYLLGGCRNGLLHIWSLKDDVSAENSALLTFHNPTRTASGTWASRFPSRAT